MIVGLESSNIRVLNIVSAIAVLIVASKILIPLYPVPITMQMFAVYCIGLMMRPREAFVSLLGWISLGALGYPVFASSAGGICGPSTGYLIGMLFSGPAVGKLLQHNVSPVMSCLACYVIVHIFGCFWLSNYLDWHSVLMCGVVPFIIPEFFKITMAVLAYYKTTFHHNA